MRSLSPRYLDASVAEETLKKVHDVSVAAALASMVCRGDTNVAGIQSGWPGWDMMDDGSPGAHVSEVENDCGP